MENNETIADIIAEMRALSNPISDGIIAINGRSIADRLEAALEREKAAIEADALTVGGMVEASRKRVLSKTRENDNSGAVVYTNDDNGDRAELREALLRCDAIAQLPEVRNEQSIKDMRNIIRQALSEPPRNCDRFATLEDARKEHRKICEEYGACNKACVYKSGHSGTYQCFEAWLFTPATEQKGENDANK